MIITILIIYLLLLIYIASQSYSNIENHADFFIARKKGSYIAITGSLIATILGGSAVIGAIDTGEKLGWASSWFMLCASVGLFALLPLAKKISKLGHFTLPELLGKFYGKEIKTIASLIIPIAWIGIVAAQIIASAKILQSFTGISYEMGAIISGIVFTAYTIAGGQISILKTDSIQAILILLGLLTISFFAYQTQLIPKADYSSLSFPFNNNFNSFDLFILLISYSTTFTAGPDIYSRIFCANNEKVALKSILSTAIILIPISFIIGYLSVTGAGISNTSFEGTKLIEISFLILPEWLAPLIVLTLLSAVLSSADTTILSSSIILTDLFERNNLGDKSIKKTRFIILFIGIISLIIALNFTSIIGMLLIALTIYSGAFTLPIILGLIGVKAKSDYVKIAVISGGLIALTGKLVTYYSDPFIGNVIIIASFLVNGIIFLIGHIKNTKNLQIPLA